MRPLRLGPGLFACFGSCPGTPCSVPVSLRLVLARAAALRVRSALSGATRILNLKMTRCGYWCSLNFTLIIHGRTPTDMRRLCFFHVLVRVGARRGCGIIIAQRFCATRRGDIPSRRLGRTRFFLSLSRSKPYGYPRAGVFVFPGSQCVTLCPRKQADPDPSQLTIHACTSLISWARSLRLNRAWVYKGTDLEQPANQLYWCRFCPSLCLNPSATVESLSAACDCQARYIASAEPLAHL